MRTRTRVRAAAVRSGIALQKIPPEEADRTGLMALPP